MARRTASLTLLTLLLAVLVGVNAWILDGVPSGWLTGHMSGLLTPVTRGIGRLAALGSDPEGRMRSLEQEVVRLQSNRAQVEQLERDVAFYRAAAQLHERTSLAGVEAGIFAYRRAGGVRELVINRGTRDWVAEGDVVITASGALVGVVREAEEHSAVVVGLGDPSLDVAARIAGTEISGLVRAVGSEELLLDLVRKDEAVTEGQTVVTSGSDRFPPALVIGTVRLVQSEGTALFSVVRLDAASHADASGRVLVIRPR